MPKPWTRTGKTFDVPIALAEGQLVALYRQGIADLKVLLTEYYNKYGAVYTPQSMALFDKIKAITDNLFQARQAIISNNVQRAAVARYHDVLYMAERMIGRQGLSVPDFENKISQVPTLKTASLFNDLKNIVNSAMYRDVDLDTWSRELARGLARQAAQSVNILHTYGTKLINEATDITLGNITDGLAEGIEALAKEYGVDLKDGLVKVWIHDDPVVPREGHVLMHGTIPDDAGYFENPLTGNKTTAPGLFSDMSENYNCRCSIELMTLQEYNEVYA